MPRAINNTVDLKSPLKVGLIEDGDYSIGIVGHSLHVGVLLTINIGYPLETEAIAVEIVTVGYQDGVDLPCDEEGAGEADTTAVPEGGYIQDFGVVYGQGEDLLAIKLYEGVLVLRIGLGRGCY